MTVTSTTNRVQYTGNGTTTVFPFTFKVFAASELEVKRRLSGGSETTLVLNTDYTVSGAGDSGGGSITLTAGALASGASLSIRRALPKTQRVDLENQGPWSADSLEEMADRAVMLIQELDGNHDRSIHLPDTAADDVDVELPDPEAGHLIAWNDDADGLVNFDPEEFATDYSAGTMVVDTFDAGDDFTPGTTDELTLSAEPGSKNNTRVSFDGVHQHRDTYSLAGAVITFTSAIPIGVAQVEVEHVEAREVGTLGDQTVDTAALDALSVTEAKIAASAVTTSKIADDAVTPDKIGSDSMRAAGANLIPNGCGAASTGEGSTALSDGTFAYGETINCKARILGGGGATGAILQSAAAAIGNSGYANRITATLDAAGNIKFRFYVEAKDARALKSRTASLSCKVYHDVGASIDWALSIAKADAADNFGATTSVYAGSNQAVATGTATTLQALAIAMGDCSNGFYVEVTATLTGAVTSKNFYLTEVKLEAGSYATDYEYEPIAETQAKLLRYYQRHKLAANENLTIGHAISTTVVRGMLPLLAPMRSIPALGSETDAAAGWQVHDGATGTQCSSFVIVHNTYNTDRAVVLYAEVAAGLTQFRPYAIQGWTSGGTAVLTLDARF